MKFTRLLLCKTQSKNNLDYISRLVYIMKACNNKFNLLNKNVNHCENSYISIGLITRYSLPIPVQSYMQNGITILQYYMPYILLKTPCRLYSISINEDIEANKSPGFFITGLKLLFIFCTNKKFMLREFCDRHIFKNWLGTKGCGCYVMSPNSISLAIQHAINIKTGTNDNLNMSEFSPLKF